jgi:hypothetical protein
MVRAADARRRHALLAREARQRLQGEVDRRVGEAVGGVDREQARPRALRKRDRVARDLPGPHLRAVGRHPRQAVALEPVRLGADQGAGDAPRRGLGRAAADEGLGGQGPGLRQCEVRHRLSAP